MKSLLRSVCLLLLAFAALPAHAVSPVNATFFGVAIKGYDPVAYFESGKPVKGDSAFAHEWNGATWRFASAAHRDVFKAAPERYAPQYGGYCAWAVAQGYTAGIDPDAWKIVAGKLYLNYSPEVQKKWAGDEPGNIAKADTHWPKLLKK
ncbi:MAG: YHS domain-containing (seleno)protein [Opitutaceae bacterium]|nr:YHS domain-containing (seleno)protein [Opitutaceae bacterium]